MTEPTLLAAPGIGRACGLWLATIGLGTFFISLFFILTVGIDSLSVVLIAGAIAAVFSLPALLLLPVSIKWALASHTAGARCLRLLGLITGLFGLATLGCYLLFAADDHSSNYYGAAISEFAAPYYVAALLAAYWLYRDWLRTPIYE